MPWWMVLLLVVQMALAVVGLHEMVRRVFPALPSLDQPALVSDVWVPLALVAPLIFLAGRVEMTVRGVGWAPIGGPVCVGVLALGAALFTTRGRVDDLKLRPQTLGSWAAAGMVLLSLGAAGDLTIWAGQVAFALAAVLLWINTPVPPHHKRPELSHAHHRVGLAMLATLLCAAGQGVIVLFTSGHATAISVGMMMGYAAAAGAGAAAAAGPRWALRIGGWAATIGMLLGVGVISFTRLAPQVAAVALPGGRGALSSYVAHSMGIYAPEGMLLLVLPAACLVASRADRTSQRLLGAAAILIGAVLIAWRVVHV